MKQLRIRKEMKMLPTFGRSNFELGKSCVRCCADLPEFVQIDEITEKRSKNKQNSEDICVC